MFKQPKYLLQILASFVDYSDILWLYRERQTPALFYVSFLSVTHISMFFHSLQFQMLLASYILPLLFVFE